MVPLKMIMSYELSYRISERVFAKQNHLVQTAFLDCSNEPFRTGIQVGRPWRQLHRFNALLRQHSEKVSRVQRIAIVNELALSLQESVYVIRHIASNLCHP